MPSYGTEHLVMLALTVVLLVALPLLVGGALRRGEPPEP